LRADRHGEKGCFSIIKPFDKSREPAIEVKQRFLCFGVAFISWHAYEKHWLAFKTWFDYRPRESSPG
jgi:hypothetical protein